MQQYFGIKKKNEIISLNSEDLNHIKNVMRMKVNDNVIVVYNNISYICSLQKDLLTAKIEKKLDVLKEKNEITAYIPVLNDEKLSFIFQKGTELGIDNFVVVEFINCKYNIKKEIQDKKINRWRKIIKEAAEQSHRLEIPKIDKIIKYNEIKNRKGVNILCSLDKHNVKHLNEVLNKENIYDKITMLFGPEGGLTKTEEDYLINKNFIKTSLGNNVLRSETVILYLTSVISYLKLGGNK